MSLVISDKAFERLVPQRGEFEGLAIERAQWEKAFRQEMRDTFDNHIPRIQGARVLDIGSGLGAIDVLLCKERDAHCTLVDGERGEGRADLHNVPFNARGATVEFFRDNAVPSEKWQYLNPSEFKAGKYIENGIVSFDLVISLRAWCFHFAPGYYLTPVSKALAPNIQAVVDVRALHPEWHQEMLTIFRKGTVLYSSKKFTRYLYEGRRDA